MTGRCASAATETGVEDLTWTSGEDVRDVSCVFALHLAQPRLCGLLVRAGPLSIDADARGDGTR